MKVREIYLKKKENKYIKTENEDLTSILTGIQQFKGNVHIEVTKPITLNELKQFKEFEKNELYNAIAKLIDSRIQQNYKLSNNNYIAFDIENNSTHFLNKEYTLPDQELFISRMRQDISKLGSDFEGITDIYLGIYSNPVKNKINSNTLLNNKLSNNLLVIE